MQADSRNNGKQKFWQSVVNFSKNGIRHLWYKEQGVETIEYLGLAAILAILVGAVAAYLSGAGQVLIDAVRDVIAAIIAGFARGW